VKGMHDETTYAAVDGFRVRYAVVTGASGNMVDSSIAVELEISSRGSATMSQILPLDGLS